MRKDLTAQSLPVKPFSFKQKIVLYIAPPLAASCVKAIISTCRIHVEGVENFERVHCEHGQAIIAVWHETMAMAACYHRNSDYCTLTSHSFDGELAARVARQFGIQAARGSSSRGGREAVAQLQRVLAHGGTIGFTLDGPKGPRRMAKAGIAVLSARSGIPVIPQAFHVDAAWRMKSWDRLAIPKPFAHIRVLFGTPIAPPADTSHEAIEETRAKIERELNALHARLEHDGESLTAT